MRKIKIVRPRRLQIGERVFAIIKEEINREIWKEGNFHDLDKAAGRATERVLKIVQNNYRRRIY